MHATVRRCEGGSDPSGVVRHVDEDFVPFISIISKVSMFVDYYFYPMRRIPILCYAGALSAIFLVVACGSHVTQSEQNPAPPSESAKLDLRPEHGSGASGSVSFEDISDGVVVELALGNLPKPDAFYLAHIHSGTCAKGGEEREPHEHEEYGTEKIEYPLSPVRSDSKGGGLSTTTLHGTSVEKLLSGGTKRHVNLHAAGNSNPPILTCADLREAGWRTAKER